MVNTVEPTIGCIFVCVLPPSRTGQIALTLRAVCGLTTAQIARAFVLPEPTVGQRITRAKRKISEACIPYRMPDPDELAGRLSEVLTVVYLLFNEGYLTTAGDRPHDRDLADEAEFLAALLHRLMLRARGRAAGTDPVAPGPHRRPVHESAGSPLRTRTETAGTMRRSRMLRR